MSFMVRASSDPRVDAALTAIEAELKVALATAAGRLHDLLVTEPQDTMPVHSHLAVLHGLMAEIDRNRDRRQRGFPRF